MPPRWIFPKGALQSRVSWSVFARQSRPALHDRFDHCEAELIFFSEIDARAQFDMKRCIMPFICSMELMVTLLVL